METKKYVRKSFGVEAVQVTEENITEVAEWCDADIQTESKDDGQTAYLRKNIVGATKERQRRAYLGDWVLRSKVGFKFYNNKAFASSFEMKDNGVGQPVGNVFDNDTEPPVELHLDELHIVEAIERPQMSNLLGGQ